MRVYLASISKLEKHAEAGSLLLTPERRARMERYLHKDDKLRCMAAGLLLHFVLGVVKDDDLSFGPHGKPYLAANPDVHFSLAHSGDYALLAVGKSALGVDIEHCDAGMDNEQPSPGRHKKNKINPALARRCMADDEYAAFMRGGAKPDFFCRMWTAKESILKGTGLGLQGGPASFSVLPVLEGIADEPQNILSLRAVSFCDIPVLFGGQSWFVMQCQINSFWLALACSQKPAQQVSLIYHCLF